MESPEIRKMFLFSGLHREAPRIGYQGLNLDSSVMILDGPELCLGYPGVVLNHPAGSLTNPCLILGLKSYPWGSVGYDPGRLQDNQGIAQDR